MADDDHHGSRLKLKFSGIFHKKAPIQQDKMQSIEEEEYIKEMKRRMRSREKTEQAERTRSYSEVPSERFKTISNSVGDNHQRGPKNYSFYAEKVEDLPHDILMRFVCFFCVVVFVCFCFERCFFLCVFWEKFGGIVLTFIVVIVIVDQFLNCILLFSFLFFPS